MSGSLDPVQLFMLVICVLGPAFAIYRVMTLAKSSGWTGVAERFPGPPKPPEGAKAWCSGNLGKWTRLKSTLTVGLTAEGLYLSAKNPGMNPIFAPWSQIEMAPPEAQTFNTITAVTFPEVPGFQLELWGDIGEKTWDARQAALGED